jgi:hypothetical protein
MTPLRGFLLTDSPQTFRQGVGAFRNARDLAKEYRERFIEQANAVARAQSADTMSFNTSHDTVTSMQERLIDSDTSTDELALDYSFEMSRTKRQKKSKHVQVHSVRCESHIRHRNISFHQKGSVKLLSRNTSLAIVVLVQRSPR